MINLIREYLEKIDAQKLGLKGNIRVQSVKSIGMGKSNINYLVIVNDKKFLFRVNIEPRNSTKSRREYESLKLIQKFGIAPIPYFIDDSMVNFPNSFIIIDYLEGKSLDHHPYPHSKKIIKQLGKLCAKLHSINLDGTIKLKYSRCSKNNYLELINNEFSYIQNHIRNNEFKEKIKEAVKKLEKIKNANISREKVFSQGDFCEQNIIYYKYECYLIDFEDASLTYPAAELARIFVDFGRGGFNSLERKDFLREYYKIRNIANKIKFEKEVESFEPYILLFGLVWSIAHIIRIRNKEFDKEFLKNNNIRKDYSYTEYCIKKAIKNNLLDKSLINFDLERTI